MTLNCPTFMGTFNLKYLHQCITAAMERSKDPEKVLVFIKEDWHKYPIFSFNQGIGNDVCELEFFKNEEIREEAPDVRPEGGGEYWSSRGPSNYDVSGFIKSKQAGERLLRFVKYVLEKDEVESWLDWRPSEPTWIQFKFSAKEFNVELLHYLTKANNCIITEEIIKDCKL